MEDSDDLRRYMAKKHLNGMTKYKPTFVQNAINNGYTEQQANELFKWLGDVLPYSLNNELQRELLSNG